MRAGQLGSLRFAVAAAPIALVAVGVGLGCMGAVDRTYFDDSVDGAAGMTDAPSVETTDGGSGGTLPEAGVTPSADCGPTNTTQNCAGCGNACNTTNSLSPSCNGATCAYSGCSAGWGDCVTTAPNTDGCETRLNTLDNCTGCGVACDMKNSTGASCNGTTCSYTGCRSGFDDCDKTPPNSDGCESALDTIANCGACGVACDTMTSTGASCVGNTCKYMGCQQGWSMCNPAAPNTLGCSCHTPGCCGNACQVAHDDGLGDTFYDCNPLNTYTVQTATEACIAFTKDATQCTNGVTGGTSTNPLGPCECSWGSPTNCACWCYGGKDVGLVYNAGVPGPSNCALPTTIANGALAWH